jgi:hypothetical protein
MSFRGLRIASRAFPFLTVFHEHRTASLLCHLDALPETYIIPSAIYCYLLLQAFIVGLTLRHRYRSTLNTTPRKWCLHFSRRSSWRWSFYQQPKHAIFICKDEATHTLIHMLDEIHDSNGGPRRSTSSMLIHLTGIPSSQVSGHCLP